MVQSQARDYDLSTPIVDDLEEAFQDLSLEPEEEDFTTEIETEKEVNLPHVIVHPLRN
jgi:hypothetical protein